MKKYNIHILLIIIIFYQCKHKEKEEKVTFYLSNSSSTNPKVDLNVFIDGEKIIGDTFNYTDIRPDEIAYERILSRGTHELLVKGADSKVQIKDHFEVGDTLLNIFIFYSYHYPDPSEIKAEKGMNYLIHKDSLKGLDTNHLISKEHIGIHYMKGKILPM